jgi:hypothetical protein
MTGILADWSTGLEKKWEVDFLCQHRSSVTWSAPVIQGNRLVTNGTRQNIYYLFLTYQVIIQIIGRKMSMCSICLQ